jgi:hypothetical protein
MPYLNDEYLTDDEISERRAAQRGQQAREVPPIRSMYQPEGSQRPDIPGDWRPERAPGPYGRPWGSPNYGAPLTQAQMRREADERAIRARNRAAGQSDPAFDYERPRGGRDIPMPEVPQGPWGGPVGPLPSPEDGGPWERAPGPDVGMFDRERMPPPRQETGTLRPSGVEDSLRASGQRARAIAREAFAGRPQLAQSRETMRRGGRRGRPGSRPGAGARDGFRLGDLLGAGALPAGAALGGWMGGRRA